MTSRDSSDALRVESVPVKSDQLSTLYIAGVVQANGDFKVFNFTVEGAPNRVKLPLVAFSQPEYETLRRLSQEAANATGQTVSIISFTNHNVCDTVQPVATGD